MTRTYTDEQWREFPESEKGRVTHDYNPGRLPGEMVGRRTVRMGGRRLVEGIDFRIRESLV